MYKKDFILNETQRLAQLLARLAGLKQDNKEIEAQQYFSEVLTTEYEVNPSSLLPLSDEAFKTWLTEINFSSAKVNALGEMLYLHAHGIKDDSAKSNCLQKVLIVFDLLEQKYHLQSFENLARRNRIAQQLQH